MSDFEQLVRPFQSRVISPSEKVIQPLAVEPENVVLQIGIEGTTKTFTGSFNQQTSGYMSQHQREISRIVVEKDVKNPDDPLQHVVVNDTKEIQAEQGSGRNYQKITTTYKDAP